MAPQAAALADARALQRRAGRPADAPRPSAPLSDLRPGLPGAVADRLARLMASDPALAEAVSARLPAARLESASDLATYSSTPIPGRALDITG